MITEDKPEFEVINRIIETKLMVIPEYNEIFRYKDHYYILKSTLVAIKADEEEVKWWLDNIIVLEEYKDSIEGELLNKYTLTFKEYLDFGELEIDKMLGYIINNEIFSKIANNFINKEFKPNKDKYYTI